MQVSILLFFFIITSSFRIGTSTETTDNINPTAEFVTSETYLQVDFDGSSSTDSDGSIVSYVWNFGEPSSGSNNIATDSSPTSTHIYTEAGSYIVTLTVTDNEGASGTSTQTITVAAQNSNPIADFVASQNYLQVNFDGSPSTDSDGSIASYVWNFGESASGSNNAATGSTATHTYTQAGSYIVTLTVTDNEGATGTSTQTITVTAQNLNPISAFTVAKNYLQVNFDGSSSTDSDGSIVSYVWNFGESSSGSNNVATGSTTTHTYAQAGSYTITLTVTDNQGSAGMSTQTITVVAQNSNPIADFIPSQNYLQVNFDGSPSTDSDGSIASYVWNFGESSSGSNNVATGSTTIHTYAQAGSYLVTLTVTDNEGATGTSTQTITVTAQNLNPISTFTVVKNYLQVNFDGSSSTDSDGSLVSYVWNFGEPSSGSNNVATESSPTSTHTYAVAGSYIVTLTVTDNEGATGTSTQTITVIAPNINPISAFTVVKNYLQIDFDGSSSTDSDGSIVSYVWDFGESTSGSSNVATGTTATHTYAQAGSYIITLTVTDNQGSTGTSTQTITVIAPNVNPISAFTVVKNYLQVNFDGTASNDPDGSVASYVWDFGESTSGSSNVATGTTVTHTYAQAGSYIITLTVTDNQGSTGTSTQTITVIAPNVNPISTFTVVKNYLQVNFDGSSSNDPDGSIVSYMWDFGESSSGSNNVATGSTATHTYTQAGSYIVTLTVTDNEGATGTSTQTIIVIAPNSNPISTFTVVKNYLQVNFDGSSSNDPDGSIVSYMWDFGESSSGSNNIATGSTTTHTYTQAGSYIVTLTVTDNEGATGASTQTIIVIAPNSNPISTFTVVNNYLQVNLDGSPSTDSDGSIVSYLWDFGEPSSGSNNNAIESTTTHTYAQAGSYIVTLTVTDNEGATGTSTQTITVTAQNLNPIAAFVTNQNNLQVNFDGSPSTDSDGSIASYVWNFGEPSSGSNNAATGSTATHTYAQAGSYIAILTVTDNEGATGTSTQTITVVAQNLNPIATFTVSTNYLQVNFDGSTSTDPDDSIVSYLWDFGESTSGSSNSATGSTATHTYTQSGSYIVTLTVTDNHGATGTSTQTITVVAQNLNAISIFTVAKNYLQVNFDGSSSIDSDGSIVSYVWDFGESSSGSNNVATGSTTIHTYAQAGSYLVTLTVTDNEGATGTSTQTITVIAQNLNPIAAFVASQNYLQVSFNGAASNDPDGSVVSYAWDFGETSSGSNNFATGSSPTSTHTYAETGSYIVTLTVTDNEGATGTSIQVITVIAPNIQPSSAFIVNKNYLQVNFDGTTSTDSDGSVVSYVWDFGESTSGSSNVATGTTATHTYAQAGSYIATLTVTDNQGSTGTSTQTITVIAPNVNPISTFTVVKNYLQVNFDGSSSNDPDGSIVSYMWDFGESSSGSNNIATGSTTTHTYTQAGSYIVTLTVTDNEGATGASTQTIIVIVPNSNPISTFTVVNNYLQVNLDGSPSTDSDGSIVSYLWDFGEPSSGSNNNAIESTTTHTYTQAGSYIVTLTVTDNEGATGTSTQTITVTAQNLNPIAAFVTNQNNLQVNFDGTTSTDSDGSIASYVWNFGESSSGSNNAATGSTATHTYTQAGSYIVILTVTDNEGAIGTFTQTITVSAQNLNPIAAFVISQNNLQVNFDGSSSTDSDGSIVSYVWDFGESSSGSNNIATGSTTIHTYAQAGSYLVTLTVTDNEGATGTSTQTITVIAQNLNPTAAFVAIQNYLQVSFDGTTSIDSDGSITSYVWNFGESASGSNNVATGSTATHTYTQAGSYIVTLTVTDNQGATGTSTQTITVIAPNLNPTAAFVAIKNYLQVSFDGTTSIDSDGSIVAYVWNFGESTSGSSNIATGSTATHTYAQAGSYIVTLTATDNQGATGTSTQTITVIPQNINPISTFTVVKNYLQVNFDGTASNDPDGSVASYVWDFGESTSGSNNVATGTTATHTYAQAGSYIVTLTVTDNQGSTGTSTQTITVIAPNVNPISIFTVVKNYLQVNFDGTTSNDPDGRIVSYVWDFGESSSGSSNIAIGSTITHTYARAGSYIVTLTVTDNQGATGTSTQTITVVAQNLSPTAAFAVTKNYLQVSFNGAASNDPDGSVASYAWNFGESLSGSSNTATGSIATHTYAKAGSYTVTLTVTDNQGATGTSTQTITVIASNISPIAAFAATKNSLQVSFDGTASNDPDGSILSYVWSFGESSSGSSNTATKSTSTHTYAKAGSYIVTLTVTDNQGATGTLNQTITVTVPNVNPRAAFITINNYLQVSFNAAPSVDPDGSIASYSWNFGDTASGSDNTVNGSTGTHVFSQAGTYTVTLTVTDNLGATGTCSYPITATAPSLSSMASFTAASTNLQVTFQGTNNANSNAVIKTYAWNFGESSSGSNNIATGSTAYHTYANAGSYNVILTVTDNHGNTASSTQTITVTAPNISPTAAFVMTLNNLKVNFDGSNSADPDGTVVSYAWNFGDSKSGASNTATGRTANHTYNTIGSYTVTLTVSDNQGATGMITQTISLASTDPVESNAGPTDSTDHASNKSSVGIIVGAVIAGVVVVTAGGLIVFKIMKTRALKKTKPLAYQLSLPSPSSSPLAKSPENSIVNDMFPINSNASPDASPEASPAASPNASFSLHIQPQSSDALQESKMPSFVSQQLPSTPFKQSKTLKNLV